MIQSTADFLPVLPESGHLGSSILYFHPPTITKKGRLLDTIEETTSSVYLILPRGPFINNVRIREGGGGSLCENKCEQGGRGGPDSENVHKSIT